MMCDHAATGTETYVMTPLYLISGSGAHSILFHLSIVSIPGGLRAGLSGRIDSFRVLEGFALYAIVGS